MEVIRKESSDNQGNMRKGEVRRATKATQSHGGGEEKRNEGYSEVTDQIEDTSRSNSRFRVAMFDYSAENHFKAMDMIYKLCSEADYGGFDECEIERLASTITFLSEWRYFNYQPRIIRFARETGPSNEKEDRNEIILSQFSAAMVPKYDMEEEEVSPAVISTESRKDFLLYVGGLVWALDWCPRPDQGANSDTQCEFIAVAAHPPDSAYHKLGEPLSGRGMIQIWCLLNCASMQAPLGNTKRNSQKKNVANKEENQFKRPRGRPRKYPKDKTPAPDPEGQSNQALVVQLPENDLDLPRVDENIRSTPTKQISQKSAIGNEGNKPKKPRGRPRKNAVEKIPGPDPEGQSIHALVVNLPENTLDVPLLDENIPSNVEAFVGNAKQISQKSDIGNEGSKPMKPRGRPRKNAMDKTLAIVDPEGQFIPALAVQLPEETSNVLAADKNYPSTLSPKKYKRRKQKVTNGKNTMGKTTNFPDSIGPYFEAITIEFPGDIPKLSSTEEKLLNAPGVPEETGKKRKVKRAPTTELECTISSLRRKSRNKSKVKNHPSHCTKILPTQIDEENCSQKDDRVSDGKVVIDSLSDLGSGAHHDPKDVVLPRVVMCLGHDGKVAWDVKWRPLIACGSVNKHRMGYLAVVLGNGSVEVWEVPSPQIIKCIYPSRQGEGTDPRFAKLKPVFRCSILKYGDRQSMPLTVEWSASPPHDMILAGCHDGVVALWKFSTGGSSDGNVDARPLLCFSADSGPIRALSWAPFEGDPESRNVIVTAGHGGLKFWDLRDPYRPLWDANPSQHFIYSLHWLPDPRCIVVSYDDGTLRILSLSKAAYDVPVTGEAFTGTQQQGLHSYYCSSFAIWSIHVSRLTGMVAYCSADGTVLYFQLTHKAVEKDPLRNRAPHFLCGSLANEESTVTINMELPSSPHRMKKSATEWANTPRSARSVVSGLNQAKRSRKGMEETHKLDDQVLALCYGDDPGNGGDISQPPEWSSKKGKEKEKEKEKGKTSKWKKAEENNEEVGNTRGENGIPPPPPPAKMVSMYKVRWNLNKGSERWLCYGGAAGFVRCQEILPPVFDIKLLRC